jgi:hypothetical protein
MHESYNTDGPRYDVTLNRFHTGSRLQIVIVIPEDVTHHEYWVHGILLTEYPSWSIIDIDPDPKGNK